MCGRKIERGTSVVRRRRRFLAHARGSAASPRGGRATEGSSYAQQDSSGNVQAWLPVRTPTVVTARRRPATFRWLYGQDRIKGGMVTDQSSPSISRKDRLGWRSPERGRPRARRIFSPWRRRRRRSRRSCDPPVNLCRSQVRDIKARMGQGETEKGRERRRAGHVRAQFGAYDGRRRWQWLVQALR